MRLPSPHPWIVEITKKAEAEAPKNLPGLDLSPTHAILAKALAGDMTIAGFAHVIAWLGSTDALAHVHFKAAPKVEILKLTRSRLLPLPTASTAGLAATLPDADRLEISTSRES